MKLVCPDCQRENETERVYCHDCGARLDRTVLTKAKATEETPEETKLRLDRMFKPRGLKARLVIKKSAKLLLGAIAAAGLVQMVRSPDLPESSTEVSMEKQINLEIEDAAMTPRAGQVLRYTEAEVNAFLAYTVKGRQKVLTNSYLTFERAVVFFDEGVYRITVGRSIAGMVPLYNSAIFAPHLEKPNLTAKILGGSIGRMPIHPLLMEYAGILFADISKVLERDRKSIAKFDAMELHPQMVVFIPKRLAPAGIPLTPAPAPTAPPASEAPAVAAPTPPPLG